MLKTADPGTATLAEQLASIPALLAHPHAKDLIAIVSGETHISTAGFPYISDRSFRRFIEHVPHLFQQGADLLYWLHTLENALPSLPELTSEHYASLERAIKVLRTIVFTAGITSVPDLWLLRQVLSAHKAIGLVDELVLGHAIDPEVYAKEHNLQLRQLETDLHFLYARGYLYRGDGNFRIARHPDIANVLSEVTEIPPAHRINFLPELVAFFESPSGASERTALLSDFLRLPTGGQPTRSWIASYDQIELGRRVLPLVLSFRVLGHTEKLTAGAQVHQVLPDLLPEMTAVLHAAGYLRDGSVSEYGARVFARGPGPFGIIGAYHPYLRALPDLLSGEQVQTWVQRGENVAASQDANRRSFLAANDQLDKFCEQTGFRYTVFIEHAVGHGEAIRQRFERSGEETIHYFGADLEDDAIDQAMAQQALGHLPKNMQFIRAADIGEPERVTAFLAQQQLLGEPAVMMVGNGFHEIRQQTNEKMLEVFQGYQQAGLVLVFTEESALHDEALLDTAWNTYHAGFRYVHELSGQGLRPAVERDNAARWSWRKCATLGGYVVLDAYSYRSRTIYPHKRPHHKNPSISVTYFCVPHKLAEELGLEVTGRE